MNKHVNADALEDAKRLVGVSQKWLRPRVLNPLWMATFLRYGDPATIPLSGLVRNLLKAMSKPRLWQDVGWAWRCIAMRHAQGTLGWTRPFSPQEDPQAVRKERAENQGVPMADVSLRPPND
jgi:hypothetical protein